jgi:HptB-dependent secretion and biofilm anti anti-sigma factor
MAVTTIRSGDKLTISFSGNFNFNYRGDFINAYKSQPSVTSYELDFQNCTSVDSSALGLLMIFREHAEKESSAVNFTGCSPELMELFTIAQFHTIFDFS